MLKPCVEQETIIKPETIIELLESTSHTKDEIIKRIGRRRTRTKALRLKVTTTSHSQSPRRTRTLKSRSAQKTN